MEIHMQNRKKGFTLAELLVVVAIVSILAAISIPIFTRQLETSREATDLANVRSAYAEVMAAVMIEDTENEVKVVKLKQKKEKWQRIRGKRLRKRWYVTTMLPITERRKRRRS